jgi:5-methylcytosine-specific restriction endonuclease McrA
VKRINIRDSNLKERLLKEQKNKCPYCKNIIKPTDATHIDHWQSINEFGDNEESNLRVLHEQCNLEKSSKIIVN